MKFFLAALLVALSVVSASAQTVPTIWALYVRLGPAVLNGLPVTTMPDGTNLLHLESATVTAAIAPPGGFASQADCAAYAIPTGTTFQYNYTDASGNPQSVSAAVTVVRCQKVEAEGTTTS